MGLSLLCLYVTVIEVCLCLCSQPQQPSGDQGKTARALYGFLAGTYEIRFIGSRFTIFQGNNYQCQYLTMHEFKDFDQIKVLLLYF